MSLIKFAGHEFMLCPSGAMFWPAERLLIVSDLHLEKASSYQIFGTFLPPHDSTETLEKLESVCRKYEPTSLLFLGDSFHDRQGIKRLSDQNGERFKTILSSRKIIWVEGNHDQQTAPADIEVLVKANIQNIEFNHEAVKTDKAEISGHYHPSVKFSHKEQRVRRPCFVVSESKIIMPAFGSLTGGLNIEDRALKNLLSSPYKVYALGSRWVYVI